MLTFTRAGHAVRVLPRGDSGCEVRVAGRIFIANRDAAALLRTFLCLAPDQRDSEATFLRAQPWQPIAELRERLRAAIGDVLGTGAVPDEPARFKPHISVTYCNATPPATEVIRRLTNLRTRPPISLPVTSVDLLELRRDGHAYHWDIRHHIDLTG